MAGASQDPPRERLIRTALDVLADQGLEGSSLRNIARRAGVSHGAPLRHFASLADLLVRGGCTRLPHALGGDREVGGAARARCRGARAAARRVARLRGMRSREPRVIRADVPPRAARRRQRELSARRRRGVRAASSSRCARPRTRAGIRSATRACSRAPIWASLHGLATLWAQGALSGPVPRASLEDALTTALELLLDGAPGGTR